MKKLLLIPIFISSLFAKEYMTQIKPYETFEIKSQVSGLATFVDKSKETKYINTKSLIVKLDSKDEKIELQGQKNLLVSQNEIVKIKKSNFTLKNRIKLLSTYDKNNEKVSYLEAKKELVNTRRAIKTLENTITKKTFEAENRYIGEIFVNQGEYVEVGAKVFDMYDVSKLKISLYLTKKEIENLKNQKLFINEKSSDFKVEKIHKMKDSVKVSRYKVDFVKINENKENFYFDEIVKVELK